MSKVSPVWAWTPLFSRCVTAAEHKPDPDDHIIRFDPADPGQMLLAFRQIREDEGDRPIIVFDVARFPDDTRWSYVADTVNRSGTNPLRGLGAIMREPFIDLSWLYSVPVGSTGVKVVALGTRFSEAGPLPVEFPVCSHLHDAAILAHAEGFTVTGIVVAEAHASRFDFSRFH